MTNDNGYQYMQLNMTHLVFEIVQDTVADFLKIQSRKMQNLSFAIIMIFF